MRAAVAKAKELRVKFALMGNTMPLDKVPLPDIHGNASVNSQESESLLSQGAGSRHSAGGGGRRRSPGAQQRRHSSTSQSLASLDARENQTGTEPNIDHVLEKIRKKTGGKVDWDEQKLRDLAKSR